MKTRKQYMDGEVSHQEYYEEIAREIGMAWTDDATIARFRASTDPHFNDIRLSWWDRRGAWMLSSSHVHKAMKDRGDSLSLAGIVCILKAAARVAIAAPAER